MPTKEMLNKMILGVKACQNQQEKRVVYHIIMRGINCQTVFEDEEDCAQFLEALLIMISDDNEKRRQKFIEYINSRSEHECLDIENEIRQRITD